MANAIQQDYILLEKSVSDLPVKLGANTGGKVVIGNSIGDVTSFLLTFSVSLCLVAVVFRVMYGGFTKMTTDSVYKKTESSEIIARAIGGLVSALFISLIIHVINPDMWRNGLDFASYKVDKIDTPKQDTATSILFPTTISVPTPSANEEKFLTKIKPYEQFVRDSLGLNGIKINRALEANQGACQSTTQKDCTTVGGLPELTPIFLKKLKNECTKFSKTECEIVITGGTEFWLHSSHGPEKNVVDLRKNDALDLFLKTKGTPMDPGTSCVTAVFWQAWNFCDEKSSKNFSGIHWHISGPKP